MIGAVGFPELVVASGELVSRIAGPGYTARAFLNGTPAASVRRDD